MTNRSRQAAGTLGTAAGSTKASTSRSRSSAGPDAVGAAVRVVLSSLVGVATADDGAVAAGSWSAEDPEEQPVRADATSEPATARRAGLVRRAPTTHPVIPPVGPRPAG